MEHFLELRTRSLLLASCLLTCLACATPFPFEKLEKGMTAETVREKVGAPVASRRVYKQASSFPPKAGHVFSAPPGFITSSTWTYLHEEQNWFPTVLFSSIFLPHCLFPSALFLLPKVLFSPDEELWSCAPMMKDTKPVVLHFEAEKLVRWKTFVPGEWVDDLYRMEP